MKDNKLIAEFMGVGKLHEAQSSNQWNQYHTSWDKLMLIVERIENLGFEFTIVENRCKVAHNTDNSIEVLLSSQGKTSKLAHTYDVVVEFIKWYNKQS
jgi:hypothetical protein